MSPFHILRRSLVSAVALTALLAAPAAAHPFIAAGELPVDSLATMQLSMAHGCGGDDGGDEAVTTEVALEVPEWLRVVEVPEADDYAATTETADDGTVTAVTWTLEGEGLPAPAFDLDVVASGEPGETRHLAVFQGCENDRYRWVGTRDAPADDPAVNVGLVEADPDSPPPEEAVPAEPATDAEGDAAVEVEAGDEPTGDAVDEPEDPDAVDPDPAETGVDADPWPLALIGGVVVVAVAAVVVLASRRRRRRRDR
ncbi:MAG: hypothetical protein WD378_06175 [Egicoccus sp.]